MITISIIFLLPLLLIFYAVQTDKELNFAIMDGFMVGIVYDKDIDDNEPNIIHTIQMCLGVLSIVVTWENYKDGL
jgi:hypothetical protein